MKKLTLILVLLFIACPAFADDSNGEKYPQISPWAQVYSQALYNISGYEDYDSRYGDNDYSEFGLRRVWLGLDAQMSKSWKAQVVLAGDREEVLTPETTMVDTGIVDDPETAEDESKVEVVTGYDSAKTGQFGVWVTYAFMTYTPSDYFAVDFGMIPNAYNTQIYKYWKYNYVMFPTLYEYKMTRSAYGDLGGAIFGNFPKGYGGYRVTLLNGEGKKKAEVNSGKAAEVQVNVSPLQAVKPLKGLSLMGFYRYDRFQPDAIEQTNTLIDGILSYSLDLDNGMGFSLSAEYAQLTVTLNDGDTDPVNSLMYSGWADFWFLYKFGVVARYDYYDPNTENDEKKDIGFEDEQAHLMAGVFYNPIKQVKLCLNYRSDMYTEQIVDDKGKDVEKQPDQFIVFNTEFKFK